MSFYARQYLVNEFSDMSVADRLIAEADYERRPLVGRLVALNFRWRGAHAPLPAPTFELVHGRAEGPPGCPLEDPACRMARDGTTEWVRTKRMFVRQIA